MRLVSHKIPAPRLLSTVVPEVREKPPERGSMRSRLTSGALLSGNGRAIFLGLVLGAILISTISVFYARHQAARRHAEEERKLQAVSLHGISTSQPIVVKISADLIHVSAISLGHPRLAIINGQLLGEGERFTLHTPAASIAISLQVTRIADGGIELTDGIQTIKARLESVQPPQPKS
jgi:hypothetical protein